MVYSRELEGRERCSYTIQRTVAKITVLNTIYRGPTVKGAAHLCNGLKYNNFLTHIKKKGVEETPRL